MERGARLSAVIRKTLKTDWNRDLAGRPRVHINTVGFFYESPDVGAFLWALARENDGGFVGHEQAVSFLLLRSCSRLFPNPCYC